MIKKYIFLLLFTLLIALGNTFAEEETEESGENSAAYISGEIELDLGEEEVIDVYGVKQDNIISVFTALLEQSKSFPAGSEVAFLSTEKLPDMKGKVPQDFFKYINSAYLFCSIQAGTCKHILDSILEIDIVNSKLTGKPTCRNMLVFWRSWIDNDMEKRHAHATKITNIATVSKFNKEVRPRYTKCKGTVTKILEAGKDLSNQEFFQARSEAIAKENYIAKTEKLFRQIREKIDNLYAEVGLE